MQISQDTSSGTASLSACLHKRDSWSETDKCCWCTMLMLQSWYSKMHWWLKELQVASLFRKRNERTYIVGYPYPTRVTGPMPSRKIITFCKKLLSLIIYLSTICWLIQGGSIWVCIFSFAHLLDRWDHIQNISTDFQAPYSIYSIVIWALSLVIPHFFSDLFTEIQLELTETNEFNMTSI